MTGVPTSPILAGFDHQPRTRIIFGPGTLSRLGELAAELGGRRALLVTDAGIVAAGHVDRALRTLEAAGIEVAVYDDVRENPTTADVNRCLAAARAERIDHFIGLGGGSSLDTAKGANFLLTNGGRMQDYWGVGRATQPMLPLIAVPTTAGTGSECQSFALIADEATHQKMACGDPKAAARVALLDPELTLSQPPGVTTWTGLDAIAHAVESAVSRKRTPYSQLFSREAFRLTVNYLDRVLDRPDDLESRAAMQLGAAYAGIAIEGSMLGAAHSAANPLTAHFDVIHGQAVGLMLPHVVRFNAADKAAQQTYRELAVAAGLVEPRASDAEAVDALTARIEALLQRCGARESVDGAAIADAVETLAPEAAAQWTARFNPREIGARDFAELYGAAIG